MVVLVGLIRGDQVGGVAATDATQFYPAHGMLRASRCPRQWAGIMPQGQAPSERCKRGEFAGAGRQGFTVRNRGWTCHGKTAITDVAPPALRRADADSVSFTPSRTSTTWPLPPPPLPRQPGQSGRHLHLRDQLRKRRGKLGRADRPDRAAARRPAGTRHPRHARRGLAAHRRRLLAAAATGERAAVRGRQHADVHHHPGLAPELAPEGVFEYQHSISNEDAVSAFRRGFAMGRDGCGGAARQRQRRARLSLHDHGIPGR